MSQSLSNSQLVELAERFGTPLYVYHAEKIKEQYETLDKAFSGCKARFFYACKALTNINVLNAETVKQSGRPTQDVRSTFLFRFHR